MTNTRPKSTASRMQDYRARLRAAGLKPVQLWLPDTASPAFSAKARKQAKAIALNDPAGDEMQDFIDAATPWPNS